jgi:hypothetical protein
MPVDDLLQVVVGAVLQPDRRGVDEGGIRQMPGVLDWVAAEVKPHPCVVLGWNEGDVLGVGDIGLVSLAEILVQDDLEPHAGTVHAEQVVRAHEPCVLWRVIQVNLDEDLRRLGLLAALQIADVLSGRFLVEEVW